MTGFDLTFAGDGTVTTDTGSSDTVTQIVPVANGKTLAIGISSSNRAEIVITRYNADGSLDTGFGNGGQLNTGLASSGSNALINKNGKIVVAGRDIQNLSSIIQFLDNGTLDSTFANNGKYTAPNPATIDIVHFRLNSVTGSNEIIVNQRSSNQNQIFTALNEQGVAVPLNLGGIAIPTPAIVDLNALNGIIASSSLDASNPGVQAAISIFGEQYINELRTLYSQQNFSISIIATEAQSDGSYLLDFFASTNVGSNNISIISRFGVDGKIDNDFGTRGLLINPGGTFVGLTPPITAGKIDINDGFYEAISSPSGNELAVYHFTRNGQADRAFGNNGKVILPPLNSSGNFNISLALDIDSKERVVVVTKDSTQNIVNVIRLNKNGSLDNAFGVNGLLQLPSSTNQTFRGSAVRLGEDDRLFIGSSENNDFLVSKYDIGGVNPPGQTIESFIKPTITEAEVLSGLVRNLNSNLANNINVKITGNSQAFGSFQQSPFGDSAGIVISTGRVSQLAGINLNATETTSTDFDLPGTVVNGRDAASIEITFDAGANPTQLIFEAIFGSEEFLEYSGSSFNDAFTFELNGVNLVKLTDGNVVNINNLTPNSNSTSFNPDFNSTLQSPFVVLDGLTKRLRFGGDLLANSTNNLKITVQDISDGSLDSAAFLFTGIALSGLPLIAVNVTASASLLNENSPDSVLYTFTRSGETTNALAIDFTVGGTAIFNEDFSQLGVTNFTKTSGTVTFAPGSNQTTFSVAPLSDAIAEQNETIVLTINPGNYSLTNGGTIATTIIDPAPTVNLAPTLFTLNNAITSIVENTNTTDRIKVADLAVTDDGQGNNIFSILGNDTINGSDASNFEIENNSLFLRAGTVLDFETKSRFDLVIGVDDVEIGNSPDITNPFSLLITNINESPTGSPQATLSNTPQNTPIDISSSSLLSGFTDPEGDVLSISDLIATNGSIIKNNDGNFTFTPTTGFTGAVGLTYSISDGQNTLSGQRLSFNVVQPAPNGLNAILNETGRIYLSVDGNGTNNPTGVVQILKNPGATVRKAYLVGDSTDQGTVGTKAIVNGTTITWDRVELTDNGLIDFYSYLSDVTAIVKPTIDAATSGTLNIAVDEGSESAIYEGLALAVVFDDPNQTIDQSVILYFGGLQTTGGTAKINFAAPIDTSSTIGATLGLGVGYSFNSGTDSSQSSQVRVNGQILTSVAGNFDDGEAGDGALFTIGGLGDSPNNPPANSTDISTDDELYNLLPFIKNGDSSLTLNTINPSNDDHIFFAHLTLQGISATDSSNVVRLTIEPSSVSESGSSNLVYTFTRSGDVTNPLTVSYSVSGTAEFNSDYTQTGAANFTSTNGTVNFAAGSSTTSITIVPTVDTISESNETILLTLASSSSYAVGTTASVLATISDIVPPLVNLAPTSLTFSDSITSVIENTSTINRIKVADLVVTDDGQGNNIFSILGNDTINGSDASNFEIENNSLFLKAGTVLDFETKSRFDLVIGVDDLGVGSSPDITNRFSLLVTNVNESPTGSPQGILNDTPQNTPIDISSSSLLSGFTDPEGDVLSISGLVATNGSIVSKTDGSFTFTPNLGFIGKIVLSYGVSDGTNILANQTLNFNVEDICISGTSGNDNLIGTINDDCIKALDGDDIISGLTGNDTLEGGNGNDTYVISGNGNYSVIDSSGIDTFDASKANTGVNINLRPGSTSQVDNGTVSISSLVVGQDPNVVFVIDISGSTLSDFQGTTVGDQNQNGTSNTILDAEIAGFIALNQQLIDSGFGNTARVSVIPFDSTASIKIQNISPLADANSDGIRDIDEVLKGLRESGGTNFQAGLQQALSIFSSQSSNISNGNIIFISDGQAPLNFDAEVKSIKDKGINLRAFGAGSFADINSLRQIDPNAQIFTSTDQLIATFQGGAGTGIDTFIENVFGSQFNDSIIGNTANNNLQGNAGNDTLSGVNLLQANPGKNEVDTLTGGAGNDVFILGDTNNPFYDDSDPGKAGLNDYALFVDFNQLEDSVRLNGSIENYRLDLSPIEAISGQALFLKKTGNEPDELIAVFQGVNNLTLSSPPFSPTTIVLPDGNGLNLTAAVSLDTGAINPSSSSTFAVNPSDIILTSDEINLNGGVNSVTSPSKKLVFRPFNENLHIRVGGSDSGRNDTLDITDKDLAAITDGFSGIVFGRSNGSGNINIDSGVSFRDPILLQTPNGQANISGLINLTDNATLDFNVKSLVKSGENTLTLAGNNPITFIGNTVVNGGILTLAKSNQIEALGNAPIIINAGELQIGNNEQINNAADLTLNGGKLSLNSFNETLQSLQVSKNSKIDFGSGSSDLFFANSSSLTWAGILTIDNWSSTSGEILRVGIDATGLTSSQLSNIQFTGFNPGAAIDQAGFVTPSPLTNVIVVNDLDGVSDTIENFAPNSGDGNLDGILDSKQDNVASLFTSSGNSSDNVATFVVRNGAKITGLQLLPTPIAINDVTSLANPAEFKITGIANGAATTVEYLIPKADQTKKYNTYLMSGKTADNPTTHLYEFLYDGKTGAEFFDTNNDGFTDKVILHFIDGQRGDNDLTVNGEIQDPGAPGVSSSAVTLVKVDNNILQVLGKTGSTVVNFSLISNQTKQVNEVGVFKIDANNTVNGIAIDAKNFAQVALQNGEVVFSALADQLLATSEVSRQIQVSAGDRLGFYVVKNGTVDAALQKNDFSNVQFSLPSANTGSANYFQADQTSNNNYLVKWEGGNVSVDDDLLLRVKLQESPLTSQNLLASSQGNRESEFLDLRSFGNRQVSVGFSLKRDASYNNTVGFYKIEDAQGTIDLAGTRLSPGQKGYDAAVIQSRIAGIDLSVGNLQTVNVDKDLLGGAIYAPFLIANGNASNLNGNFANVYTPFSLGNSDLTDHVRLLGDNTFGFEDLVGGGDRDFNDVVLKAVLKSI